MKNLKSLNKKCCLGLGWSTKITKSEKKWQKHIKWLKLNKNKNKNIQNS